MIDQHQHYMQRCLQLASKGLGSVAPNPMVGCVLVYNERIIGEGFHRKFGEGHAEVNAIKSVSERHAIRDSTLYVNLEPCAHHGKTPPCTDLIIEHGIRRVVVGCSDPNPLVSGRGLEMLKRAGTEVLTGVLEAVCTELNKRFFTWHQKQRPYIILKWAQSVDGFMDRDRSAGERGMNWITSEASRQLVHLWRTQEQAVLVGGNTLRNDNPQLTVRLVHGKNPLRVLLTPNFRAEREYHALSDEADTLIFFKKSDSESQKIIDHSGKYSTVQFELLHDGDVLQQVTQTLYKRQIQSLIVEGGSFTLQQFIEQNLWDEARVFTGNIHFSSGLKAPIISGKLEEEYFSGRDKVQIYYNR